jgi:hypothetical protein
MIKGDHWIRRYAEGSGCCVVVGTFTPIGTIGNPFDIGTGVCQKRRLIQSNSAVIVLTLMFPRGWVDPVARSGDFLWVNTPVPYNWHTNRSKAYWKSMFCLAETCIRAEGARHFDHLLWLLFLYWMRRLTHLLVTHTAVVWKYIRPLQSGCRCSVQGL